MKRLIAAFFLMFPSYGIAWPFGPSTYDECITDSMRGVQSNLAARLVKESCERRFGGNEKELPSRNLTDKEMELLDGRASGTDGGYFSGDLYNGNSGLTISRLLVAVVTQMDGKRTVKQYDVKVKVLPLTNGSFSFSYVPGDKGAPRPWFISGATGYATP